jgi:hypothetical protein
MAAPFFMIVKRREYHLLISPPVFTSIKNSYGYFTTFGGHIETKTIVNEKI